MLYFVLNNWLKEGICTYSVQYSILQLLQELEVLYGVFDH